ncbi:MAG: hypothetical protein ACI91B_001106 [Planctomycetota bacterium]|jgi:hypothetical protein
MRTQQIETDNRETHGAELPSDSLAAETAAIEPGPAVPLPSDYLGPARVLSFDATSAEVLIGHGAITQVRFAFSTPYSPALGDELLVIGKTGAFFAIGVLAGSGRTEIALQGDVEVRAVGGSLRLTGDRGVSVHAPEVTVQTGAMKTFAKSVVEKADTACRWVRGLLTQRSGESHTVVDGEDYSCAETRISLAAKVNKIDGGSVQLGH